MHRWVLATMAWFLCYPVLSAPHALITPVADEPTWQAGLGSVAQVDCEMFLGPVGSEYPGIAFGPHNGGSPVAIAAFSHSGQNCMLTAETSQGGGWSAELDTPVQGFAF